MNFCKFLLLFLLIFVLCDGKGGRGGGGSRGGGSRGGGSRSGSSTSTGRGRGRGGTSRTRGGSRVSSSGGKKRGKGSAISTKKVKKGLALAAGGLAAGYVLKKGAKFIFKAGKHSMFHGGRNFYWHRNGIHLRGGQRRCDYDIDDDDDDWRNFWLTDSQRLRKLYYICDNDEHCCGLECCSNPRPDSGSGFAWWAILLIVLGILLLVACCACGLIYFFCRSVLNCIFPDSDEDKEDHNNSIPMQPQPAYMDGQNSGMYPGQPPQYTAYPAQKNYPAYPDAI